MLRVFLANAPPLPPPTVVAPLKRVGAVVVTEGSESQLMGKTRRPILSIVNSDEAVVDARTDERSNIVFVALTPGIARPRLTDKNKVVDVPAHSPAPPGGRRGGVEQARGELRGWRRAMPAACTSVPTFQTGVTLQSRRREVKKSMRKNYYSLYGTLVQTRFTGR